MQIVNLATVAVDTTATGTEILSSAAAQAAQAAGLEWVGINPSVDIALIDPTGGNAYANIPGAIAGTVANSPWVCPAGMVTPVRHRAGSLKAISTAGTSTVKISLGCAP